MLLWPVELQVHSTVSPASIVTEEGKKKKPPSPTVTIVVAAPAGLGQSARRIPINRIAPTLLNEKVLVFLSVEFVGKLCISILPRAGDSYPANWLSLGFQSRRTLVRARPSSAGKRNGFVTIRLIATEAVGPLEWQPCPSSICPAPMAPTESVCNGLWLDIAALFFSSYCPRFVCGSGQSALLRPEARSRGRLPQRKRKSKIQFPLTSPHSPPEKRFT